MAALKRKAACGVAFEPFQFLGSVTLQAGLLLSLPSRSHAHPHTALTR